MRDRNVLLMASIIVIITAMAYYSGGAITGNAVSTSDSIVTLSPRDIDLGSTITISIDPGIDGINRYATFLKGVSPRGSIILCNNSRSLSPDIVEFKIPENWGEGPHSLKFYDYGTESFREVHFNTRRK